MVERLGVGLPTENTCRLDRHLFTHRQALRPGKSTILAQNAQRRVKEREAPYPMSWQEKIIGKAQRIHMCKPGCVCVSSWSLTPIQTTSQGVQIVRCQGGAMIPDYFRISFHSFGGPGDRKRCLCDIATLQRHHVQLILFSSKQPATSQ